MGMTSPVHIIILAVIAMLLFGGGRLSGMMGDAAKGIKAFKKGMAEPDEPFEPQSALEAPGPVSDGVPGRTEAVRR